MLLREVADASTDHVDEPKRAPPKKRSRPRQTVRAHAPWLDDHVAADRCANRKIDHIVVLMIENRSFDHMLGYLSLEAAAPTSTA